MKHSSLLGQFISYEENEVLWIRPQIRCFLKFFYFILLVYSIIQPDCRILKNAMAGKAGQKNDWTKLQTLLLNPFVVNYRLVDETDDKMSQHPLGIYKITYKLNFCKNTHQGSDQYYWT